MENIVAVCQSSDPLDPRLRVDVLRFNENSRAGGVVKSSIFGEQICGVTASYIVLRPLNAKFLSALAQMPPTP